MTQPIAPVYFLLVDDLEENLLALEALLKRDGLALLTARSGPEALELLLKYDVALALLDVDVMHLGLLDAADDNALGEQGSQAVADLNVTRLADDGLIGMLPR